MLANLLPGREERGEEGKGGWGVDIHSNQRSIRERRSHRRGFGNRVGHEPSGSGHGDDARIRASLDQVVGIGQTGRSLSHKVLFRLVVERLSALELCTVEFLEHGFYDGDFNTGDGVGDPVWRRRGAGRCCVYGDLGHVGLVLGFCHREEVFSHVVDVQGSRGQRGFCKGDELAFCGCGGEQGRGDCAGGGAEDAGDAGFDVCLGHGGGNCCGGGRADCEAEVALVGDWVAVSVVADDD